MTSNTNVLQAESTQGCHSVIIDTQPRKRACSVVNTDTACLTLQLCFQQTLWVIDQPDNIALYWILPKGNTIPLAYFGNLCSKAVMLPYLYRLPPLLSNHGSVVFRLYSPRVKHASSAGSTTDSWGTESAGTRLRTIQIGTEESLWWIRRKVWRMRRWKLRGGIRENKSGSRDWIGIGALYAVSCRKYENIYLGASIIRNWDWRSLR